MISIESMMLIEKSSLEEASKMLKEEDIQQLIEWLSLKDDSVRYQAFLLLQNRSGFAKDVYSYWDIFKNKLKSSNSYQRSIGLMLIAENAKWDTESKMDETIDEYLELLKDEKPITIRQCIQSITKIVPYKPALNDSITRRLLSFDLMGVKETMRKLILMDILNVFIIIRKEYQCNEIETYLIDAMTGGILDSKAKKQIQALL